MFSPENNLLRCTTSNPRKSLDINTTILLHDSTEMAQNKNFQANVMEMLHFLIFHNFKLFHEKKSPSAGVERKLQNTKILNGLNSWSCLPPRKLACFTLTKQLFAILMTFFNWYSHITGNNAACILLTLMTVYMCRLAYSIHEIGHALKAGCHCTIILTSRLGWTNYSDREEKRKWGRIVA